jgi:hypothetical protein
MPYMAGPYGTSFMDPSAMHHHHNHGMAAFHGHAPPLDGMM